MSQNDSPVRGGKARERHRRRRERQTGQIHTPARASVRTGQRQAAAKSAIKLPQIALPSSPLFYLIPVGLVALVAIVFLLGRLKNEDTGDAPNAIWLDSSWTYGSRSAEEVTELVNRLREHQIGAVYAFISSLKPDGTWSGNLRGANNFSEVQPNVIEFVGRMRDQAPQLALYGWIEIQADADEDDYRLDDRQLHQNAANMAEQITSALGFDGVFLDVKPLWSDNEDLLLLLRAVHGQIGLETPLIVAVPPDLTPEDVGLENPRQIAPGTQWSQEYKQRVALQANQMVIRAHHSYRDDPLEYIQWVAYQVASYNDALSTLDTGAEILVSIPNYTRDLPAHNPQIESIAAALDGVNLGIESLGPDATLFLRGVALFTDTVPTDADWTIFREKWLR